MATVTQYSSAILAPPSQEAATGGESFARAGGVNNGDGTFTFTNISLVAVQGMVADGWRVVSVSP